MFTGLPLYLGIGALAVIIALSGALWVFVEKNDAKAEKIAAMELAVDAWEKKVEAKEAKIEELRTTIAEQNEKIDEMAEWGRIAEERQRTIDELMAERARATEDLRLISEKYREMRERLVEYNVCETYEMVMRTIAQAVSP
jgi:uncharacterized protein HemX